MTNLTQEQKYFIWDNFDWDLILHDLAELYAEDWKDRQTTHIYYDSLFGEVIDYIGDAINEPNDDWFTDLIYERADGKVDIYNNSLYKSVPVFYEYIEEATEEYWRPKEGGLSKAIQMGQWLYYEKLWKSIVDTYIKRQEENK